MSDLEKAIRICIIKNDMPSLGPKVIKTLILFLKYGFKENSRIKKELEITTGHLAMIKYHLNASGYITSVGRNLLNSFNPLISDAYKEVEGVFPTVSYDKGVIKKVNKIVSQIEYTLKN